MPGQRRDMNMQLAHADRKPCPACDQLADEIFYGNALIEYETRTVGDVMHSNDVRIDFKVSDVELVEFRPCGHAFDGRTGALITKT